MTRISWLPLGLSLVIAGWLGTSPIMAQNVGVARATLPKVTANKAEEPVRAQLDLARAAQMLDALAVDWTTRRNCGTCHTNYPYLLARPALGGDLSHMQSVRKYFENRIQNWDSDQKGAKPRWDTEVVATAATLAIHDAFTTNKLHPLTRQALDRMWKLQRPNGAWNWLKCNWPPMEHDDYYGAVYAVIGVGYAPDGYATSESAKDGVAKLKQYLTSTPAPNLHHKALLLWASLKLDGLMTSTERQATIQELMALQREDGGWSLPSLGDWVGNQKPNNDKNAPSDGYATGLIVYIVRQAGVPAEDGRIRRAVDWLKANQRESGRWFTRSLNTEGPHYIANAGTAFATMALTACNVK